MFLYPDPAQGRKDETKSTNESLGLLASNQWEAMEMLCLTLISGHMTHQSSLTICMECIIVEVTLTSNLMETWHKKQELYTLWNSQMPWKSLELNKTANGSSYLHPYFLLFLSHFIFTDSGLSSLGNNSQIWIKGQSGEDVFLSFSAFSSSLLYVSQCIG